MNSFAMEGDAWKVMALLALLAAIVALSLPVLFNSSSYVRVSTSRHAINHVAVPTGALVGFYTSGWQLAIGLLFIGGFLTGRLLRRVVRKRLPDGSRDRNSALVRVISTFHIMFALFIVFIDNVDLLRVLPFISFILIPMVNLFQTSINVDQKTYRSGVEIIAINILMIFLCAGLIIASELIWRFTSLEAWMWFYAYSTLVAMFVGSGIVVLVASWSDAGEPGLRDP